ncbi:hypothetical protein MED121_07300 [Marinomonas sp. MED121]|uniref:phage tail protein n=1 Tax=Marinomonas sp. MED121 TaxID=314277 RepID=UPI00006902BF|nr:phage tail protein [Marinomonas sp. MED121]EAQ66471.1 hypothetical protein MED121_07300 [Marinomonas sp. MED121]
MQKLEALTLYITDKMDLSAEAISAQVTSMVLKPKGRDEGNQVLLHSLCYQATLNLIGFPYQAEEIARFNAHLMTWLADHDDREALDDAYPAISLDLQDTQTANLGLSLAFEEWVYITSSADGELEYGGQNWSLSTAEMDLALSAEVAASLVSLAD